MNSDTSKQKPDMTLKDFAKVLLTYKAYIYYQMLVFFAKTSDIL